MNSEAELPEDVRAAIRANRKIDAIKLLREHQGLDLKAAKDIIDAHVAASPPPVDRSPAQSDSGIGRLVLACLVVFVIYAGYRFFTMSG